MLYSVYLQKKFLFSKYVFNFINNISFLKFVLTIKLFY